MNAITDIPGQGLTRKLAEQARALRLEDIPEDIRAWARQCVLDYDDVNLAMPGHPTVAILPALLALAEERGATGAEVLTGAVPKDVTDLLALIKR